MITSKKIAATALWVITTAVAHGKTIHNSTGNDQIVTVTNNGALEDRVYYLGCLTNDSRISHDKMTVLWSDSDGDEGETYGCDPRYGASQIESFHPAHHHPLWIRGHVHYKDTKTHTFQLVAGDGWGTWIKNYASPPITVSGDPGTTCSVNVPSAISFGRVKKGEIIEKPLTDNGQGQGTITYQPDHYTSGGGTIVNGQSGMEYIVVGLDWDPTLHAYETQNIVAPHAIELRPSGDLAAGTYTGKMVVTITCN